MGSVGEVLPSRDSTRIVNSESCKYLREYFKFFE